MNKFMVILSCSLLFSPVGCAQTPAISDDSDNEKSATITSFAECVAAGNPVTRSMPAQCHAEGEIFVDTEAKRPMLPAQSTCKDTCGDGSCAEMVCQAIGCPCAETAESCPEDCS